jgi:type IV pilus assembly protein PilA
MKRVQQGFTLIELMIVVAIIGILAAVALPAYQDYTKRARVSEGLSLAAGAKTALAEYVASNNKWPVDNTAAGLAAPTSINGNSVESVTVSVSGETEGWIKVKYNTKVGGGEIVVVGTTTEGGVTWLCNTSANTVNAKYRPSECR